MLAHPNTLAEYNSWANQRLYASCAKLTSSQITEDCGAFFKSVLGTLNHILLVDILYRERLEGVRSTFKTLDEILHHDFRGLSTDQAEEDQRWIALTKNIDSYTMNETIGFWALLDKPDRWEVPKHITKRSGPGGTGSAACSLRKSGSGASTTVPIPGGDGIWTKFTCASTGNFIISGAPSITKAKCWKPLSQRDEIARQH